MNTQFRMFHGGTFQMRWQASLPIDALSGEIHRVASGKAMHFGRQGGELSVVEGKVWLTRDSELGDTSSSRASGCGSQWPTTPSSNLCCAIRPPRCVGTRAVRVSSACSSLRLCAAWPSPPA